MGKMFRLNQAYAAIGCLLLAWTAWGQTLPDGGIDLLPEKYLQTVRFAHAKDPGARHEVVAVEGQGFESAIRVTTTRRADKTWDVVLHVPTRGKIAVGDVVAISFAMRTIASEDESGSGVTLAMVERSSPPHSNAVSIRATAGDQWMSFVKADRTLREMSDVHQVAFHLGYFPQTIEIADLRVVNYGPDRDLRSLPVTKLTYPGREPEAAWRAEAAARIEKHRKADLTVRVVDADGQPVPGVDVRVSQRRHAFGFGSVVGLQQMVAPGSDGERYREIVKTHFNKAPTEAGFRWPSWERGTPEWRADFKQRLDRTLDWLNENNIEVRGHYLMWAPIEARTQPEHLIDKPDELLAAKWEHAREMATWAGQRVQEWDAVNHIVGWGATFADVCGGNRVYADMINKGRQWAPHAEMWVNEGQIVVGSGARLTDYEKVIDELVALDAKPDGIGFMAHFADSGLPHPQEVYDRIERFSRFDCKLQFTEFDVDCGLDEQLQADYFRDALTIAFSHPRIEAVVLWGFWEGRHWKPNAALWRRDWSIKPAGEQWQRLVFETWWTDQQVTTDARGTATLRGFHGRYDVRIGQNEPQPIELGPDGAALTLRLPRSARAAPHD